MRRWAKGVAEPKDTKRLGWRVQFPGHRGQGESTAGRVQELPIQHHRHHHCEAFSTMDSTPRTAFSPVSNPWWTVPGHTHGGGSNQGALGSQLSASWCAPSEHPLALP